MDVAPLILRLRNEDETALLGADIAAALRKGDLVALSGDLGTGKTTLARATIRSLVGNESMEVPSPTYSLAQLYEGAFAIAHYDLYRLRVAAEIDELGIDEALEGGIVLVEWADRYPEALPPAAIAIRLDDEGGDERRASISGTEEAMTRFLRSRQVRDFLDEHGWQGAWRRPLAGDASARAYELVSVDHRTPRLLMNAPARPDGPAVRNGRSYSAIAHLAETVTPFVAIATVLREAGFAAPEIFAADLQSGILLLEFLAGESFVGGDGIPVPVRYVEAARLLAEIHRQEWPTGFSGSFGAYHLLPEYDRGAMMIEAELLLDWYLPYVTGEQAPAPVRDAYLSGWNRVLDHLGGETSIVLRDYHSPNIIWRGDRQGLDRLGLIDFQDALRGPTAYDLASLAQDARVTIPADLEAAVVSAYCEARRSSGTFDESSFRRDYAIMSLQRNSKILGIFVRLDRRDGKPGYLRHIPRIREYVRRSLDDPAVLPLFDLYARQVLCGEENP